MALNFNPDAFLRAQQIRDSRRPDFNRDVSQPLMQGLGQVADIQRQRTLERFMQEDQERKQRQFAMEYGDAGMPPSMEGPHLASAGSEPQPILRRPGGSSLIEQWNQRMGGGSPVESRLRRLGTRGMGAMRQDEMDQADIRLKNAQADFYGRRPGGPAGPSSPDSPVAGPAENPELTIPGLKRTGRVDLDDVGVRNLRSSSAEFETFKNELAKYRAYVDRYGTSEMTDRRVQAEMTSMAKGLQLKVKNLAQLGVISASDVPYILGQIPEPGIFSTKNGMIGGLDATYERMANDYGNKLNVSGYAPEQAGSLSLPEYQFPDQQRSAAFDDPEKERRYQAWKASRGAR
jgi:hypothetical protein